MPSSTTSTNPTLQNTYRALSRRGAAQLNASKGGKGGDKDMQ